MAIAMPTRHLGGTLGRTFNRTSRLHELEVRASQLEQYLTTQHAITQIIARSSELETALPRILQAICETTDWDFGEVWHIDRRDNSLHCAATWCVPTSSFPTFEQSSQQITFAAGKGLPGRTWASQQPVWMTNVIFDTDFMRSEIAERDGLRAGLGVPIRTDGEVIGVMTFFDRQPRHPDGDLVRMLDTVGSQIGLFVERKRIEQTEREQARLLAVMEERQRLARDLHDSVTQTLFSASVIAEMLPILWTRDPEQVKPNLDDLHQLTRDALTEMRALLVELRPPTPVKGDLAEMFATLTTTFKNRTKIAISLEVDLTYPLTADEQISLYRIAQEALHNISKHAAATQVWVKLHASAEALDLLIEDNGRGFDPMCVPIAHFGVEVMGERAQSIGAAFAIDSAPGAGTRLRVSRSTAAPA